LKTSKFQNSKTKNPQKSTRAKPPPLTPKRTLKTPKMTRRKIEDFGTSKYENK
jgi:hypothetical protein